MSLTPRWMHSNQYRAHIPDWPEDIKISRMGRVRRPAETYAYFLHLISIGRFEFQIAPFAEWKDRSEAFFKKKTRAKRADEGQRRTDIHKRPRLHPPPLLPLSPEIIDDDLEQWADLEVARLKAEAEAKAQAEVETEVEVDTEAEAESEAEWKPIGHWRPY